jgi:tetratricopeptide (TPR) repeat protein
MSRESLVFALSGVLFGLMIGWIIGSQQAPGGGALPAGTEQAAAPASAGTGQAAAALDESRVRELTARAEQGPGDAESRVELGNLYFDAERFTDAIQWYEAALKIDPADVNVSTDLGVSYYYTNQPDRALEQFEHSLSVDPGHTKTLLNMGIVRAFGKQDLEGATQAWQRLIEIAPDSPEARAARQALDGMRAAHPDGGAAAGGAAAGPN